MLNLVVLGARGATPPFSRRSYDDELCGLLLCLPVFLSAFAFSSASTTGGFAWALASTLCFAGTVYLFLETWDYLTANVPSGRITLKLRITNGYQNDLNLLDALLDESVDPRSCPASSPAAARRHSSRSRGAASGCGKPSRRLCIKLNE